MQISLIDISNYKANTYLHDNINDDKFNILISRMQDTYLQNLLGTDLYIDLQTKKISETLNDDEKKLINEYIAPCCYIKLEINALYELNIDFRNLTTGSVIDSQIKPLTAEDINLYQNEKYHQLAVPEKLLINYLQNNSDKFPKYLTKDNNGISSAKDNTSRIIFL